MSNAVRNVILIAERFTDAEDDYWPGWLLAQYLYEKIGSAKFVAEPRPIGGATALVTRYRRCDVVIGCYHFMEYDNGWSCHVRPKRFLFSPMGWFTSGAARLKAEEMVSDMIHSALQEDKNIEIVGWFTDQDYRGFGM